MLTISRLALTAFAMILLSSLTAFAVVYDDTEPEVTARVARISFMRGDVKVRRSGEEDWETASLNLPVVEGDELSTGDDSRVEVQFGTRTHVRANSNTYLQLKQLSDEGIAVSISAGTAIARVRKFDAEKDFFEMDAPGTTLAVQKDGSYRLDAGGAGSSEVRITVSNGGEARVYSANSGFQLHSGRSAKVFLNGDYAGEWETGDAERYADEFDSWATERDETIAKRVDAANYGTYYDQDIYGADELNDNGSWDYTGDYGYVWRPNASALNGYSDWSPYRYGSWRWVQPFGWTWVNDEPWGWATYHHGRWIWYHGRWVWTPYGYYRSNRSWWYPALVVVKVINRNICWYPLGYNQRFSNYNHGYHDWIGNRDRSRRPRDTDRTPGGRNGGVSPTGQPRLPRDRQPVGRVPGDERVGRSQRRAEPLETEIPATGVVTVGADTFGVGRRPGSTAPLEIARAALKKYSGNEEPAPELPDPRVLRTRPNRGFTTQPPPVVSSVPGPTRTGAGERRRGEPLDRELIKSRIFGNRQPLPITPEAPVNPGNRESTRRTGAVGRPMQPKREADRTSSENPPAVEPPVRTSPPTTERRVFTRPQREMPTRNEDGPVIEPSPRRQSPRPRQDTPRSDPAPRRELPPRQEQPQSQGQPAPRSEPPPRRDPPAQRQERPQNTPPPPKRESPPPRSDSPRSVPRSQPRKQEPTVQ